MDSSTTTPTTTPTDQAGQWMQAGANVVSPQQAVDPKATLQAAQHPNPDTQPQPQAANPGGSVSGGVPLVLRPKRGGLLGVVDKIADAMTGTTRPELYTDGEGNEFVYHPNVSRGQQWARIGAELFKGAGAGLAQHGPGAHGRAMLAGAQVAEQDQDKQHGREEELNDRAQKDNLNRANMTMLRMNMAEQAWRAARLQTEANEHDAEFSQKTVAFYHAMGGQVLGVAAHPWDLSEVLHVNPELAKDFVQRHLIEPVATIDATGHKGVTFIKMPNAEWRNQIVPPGSTFNFFNAATHDTEQHQASDGMTAGELADLNSKAMTDSLKYQGDKKEIELKEAQRKNQESEATTREKKLPSEISKNEAEADKATKEGNKAASETMGSAPMSELTTETPVNGVRQSYLASLSADDRSIVQAIGEGRKADVSAYSLGRSPTARRIAMEVTTAYPGYDFTRAHSYQKTRDAFTSGPESKAINALNTAMEHMQQMYDNASWITTTPLVSAYQRARGNQRAIDLKDAQTALVDELGKAYKAGALTIEDKKSWEGRINAWSPHEVQGNAKSFIKLLRGKLDGYEQQWRAGSPPGSVSPIPILSPGAEAAWHHIMAPAGATSTGMGTDNKLHYVDAQGKDLGVAE